MDIQIWIAYFFASMLIAISPGSGAVLSMSHGSSYGVGRTRATILGLEIGLVVILLVAGAGVGSLLIASEVAFSVVKICGALYLIYIGWSQWRASSGISGIANSEVVSHLSWRKCCVIGFLTNITNPKGILFMVAVLPQFISQRHPLWSQLVIMAMTMVIVDAIVMHGYAFAASKMQKLLRDAKAVRIQNRLFGGLLMLVGAGLFFVKRSQ